MADLEANISRAIEDFDAIEAAIKANGVDVPAGTDTSEYAALIYAVAQAGGDMKVDVYQGTENADKLLSVGEDGNVTLIDQTIKYIENLDSSNRIPLRSLESGMYILYGYFTSYEGASNVLSFSNRMLVSVRRTSSSSAVQIFYPPNNTIQYCAITDDSYERTDCKLVNMESVINKVTKITESASDDQYPSAKAVWDAVKEATSARISNVTILADKWVGDASPYSQIVTVDGATENSQVDLTPSVEQLAIFYQKDLAFVTENEDGVVTVYAIGQKPENDYTIQVTITEVNV